MKKLISTKEFIRRIMRIETSLGADARKKPDWVLVTAKHPWYKLLVKKLKLND